MMASSNLDPLLLLQDHDLPWPSSLHSIGPNHELWSQPLILSCGDHFIPDELEVMIRPSVMMHQDQLAPMVQELGLQWSDTSTAACSSLASQEEGHNLVSLSKFKEELCSSNSSTTTVLPTASSLAHFSSSGLEGVVLPSVNISRQKPCPAALLPPPAGEAELQALDMLASSARLCKSLCQASMLHSGMPLLREHLNPYGHSSYVQQAVQRPSMDNYKVMALAALGGSSGAAGGGCRRKQMEEAWQVQVLSSTKRSPRFESRSSTISSFKARKEKLGDRIAALQQLVAPFGKTDTASVLMEAIGYIKFLQDQVETLSVPYMRSSKKARTTQGGGQKEEKDEVPRLDLRSRGLCLVPLSCTSYVTNENINGGVWTPANYRGN